MLELLFVPTADAFEYVPVTADANGSAPMDEIEAARFGEQTGALGIRVEPVLAPEVKHDPSYYNFPPNCGYKRILFAAIVISIRSVYSSNSFALRPTSTWSESRQSGVPQLRCVGTEKVDCTVRGGPPPVFFLRSISRGPGLIEEAGTSKFLTRMILTSFSVRCRTGFDHLKTATLPPFFGRSSIFVAHLPSFLVRENWPRTSATRLSRP